MKKNKQEPVIENHANHFDADMNPYIEDRPKKDFSRKREPTFIDSFLDTWRRIFY